MSNGGQDDWCILRTQAGQTLGLSQGLTDAGFRAWTPTEVIVRRARRSIPRKEVTMPLMPGIVFVAWASLTDVIALSRSAMSYRRWDSEKRRMVSQGIAWFRILQIGERYARVPDAHLSGLRLAESKGLTRARRKTFRTGMTVRMMEGSFEGLNGTVESVKGGFAQVRFGGWSLSVAVALHLLVEVPGDGAAAGRVAA